MLIAINELLSFCTLVSYTKTEVVFTIGVVIIFVMIIVNYEPCPRPAESVVQCMEKVSIFFGELAILTVFPKVNIIKMSGCFSDVTHPQQVTSLSVRPGLGARRELTQLSLY